MDDWYVLSELGLEYRVKRLRVADAREGIGIS